MSFYTQQYSLEKIDAISQDIYRQFSKYKIWIFSGDLGSGKTTFIKSLCKQFNVVDTVTSPSFALVHIYNDTSPIYHIDLYRLKNFQEALSIGIEDILNSGNYCFVEWGQVIQPLLKNIPYITLYFKIATNSQERTLEITSY